MSGDLRISTHRKPGLSIAASSGASAAIECGSAQTAIFELVTISSLTGTIEVQTVPGGTWRQVFSVWQSGAVYTPIPAGTTITFTAGDIVYVPIPGYHQVRILRASGSATVISASTSPALLNDVIMVALSPGGVSGAVAKYAVIDNATSGDNTLVAAVTGKKIRVLAYLMVAAGTVTTRFESGASGTALTGQMNWATSSGAMGNYSPVGHFETAAGALLNLELSGAVSVDGYLVYQEV